jgi:hypothetical protein
MSTTDEHARRQTVFREVNENIASLTILAEIGCQLFICECSNTACAESLELTVEEYEAVRAHPTRFVVKPGHQLAGIERVVEGNGRFLVVEKIGTSAEDGNPARPAQHSAAHQGDQPW